MINVLLVGAPEAQKDLDRLRATIIGWSDEWNVLKLGTVDAAQQHLAHRPTDLVIASFAVLADYESLFADTLRSAPHALRFALYPTTQPMPTKVALAHQVLAWRDDLHYLQPIFSAAMQVAQRARSNPVLSRVIANLEDVPSPPVLYFDLREQVEQHSGDLMRMAEIAARDPSLVARVLKLANSGFYGLPRSVSDLTEAVGLIGTDALLGMVLSTHLYSGLPPPGLKLELLWQHTLQVSTLARQIAQAQGADRTCQSQCAIAGLLHDIGIIVLLENEPGLYQPMWKQSAGEEAALAQFEKNAFGVTHGELGALILMLWNLPEAVVDAVAHSHTTASISDPQLSLASRAVLAAEWLLDTGGSIEVPESLNGFDDSVIDGWRTTRQPSSAWRNGLIMRTPKLIQEFLTLVKREVQAEAASVLFYTEPAEKQTLMLLHSDPSDPVDEFADTDHAWQYIQTRRWKDDPTVQIVSESHERTIIRIGLDQILPQPNATARTANERRSDPNINTALPIDGTVLLGLRGCESVAPLMQQFSRHSTDAEPGDTVLRLATKLAWNVYQLNSSLQDPVSRLSGRMEFQIFLRRAIAAAKQDDQAISLLLINPDDFTMVNHRYGRVQGDTAVREIAEALGGCLRETDGVFRYAGAVFAIVLPATNHEQCSAVADKIRQHLLKTKYVDGREQFTFSMGSATAERKDLKQRTLDNVDLLGFADVALNRAKLSGGARLVMVNIDEASPDAAEVSPLSGVFTADSEKDYRNMLLLWEAVGLVTANPEPGAMATALVDRLAQGFQPDRMVLLDIEDEQKFGVLATNVRDDAAVGGRSSGRDVKLSEQQMALVAAAVTSGRVERSRGHVDDSTNYTSYAVPLIARDESIACLFLDGRGRRLQLDSSDIIFLNALAGQIAVALDRARLATGWILEKDRESRLLRKELLQLKNSVDHHKMVYESEQMHNLMDTLRRVAPSNATVLITGESGTGKEMLAHSIHEFSNRKSAPFVVFDCGAVAHSLLEAELFGHVKGAFTGAESASEGRISQADGGTLFLDEIGELPLQVQAKLLRFVQEKVFSPVGSATDQRVDVRIVAATNRQLQNEVGEGRFRADLYYRLQVISLEAIPLRHRRDDILPLVEYYLEKLSVQNDVPVRALSMPAKDLLEAYDWPGNVRELQHCMMRAILVASGTEIMADDIELVPEPSMASTDHGVATPLTDRQPHVTQPQVSDSHNVLPPQETPATDRWQQLRDELLCQIEHAMRQNRSRPVPLGRWLTEDLVKAASAASNHVARRAANLVGIPESTFRRHFQKAEAEESAGLAVRTEEWHSVKPLLEDLVRSAHKTEASNEVGTDLVDQARLTLLADVTSVVDGKISVGAALMGVSTPTYKRWLADAQGQAGP